MREIVLACAVSVLAESTTCCVLAQGSGDRVAYDGVLDSAQDEAVKQWPTLLWNRIENGSPSAEAFAFAFSDPVLASPLFQPPIIQPLPPPPPPPPLPEVGG